MKNAPIVNAHFLANDTIQIYQDVGPGQIYMDVISFGDPDYEIALAKAMFGQFDDRREYPEQPSPNYVWNKQTFQWEDPRTADDIQKEIYARRNAAQLDKTELIGRLMMSKILTPDQAIEARNDVPAFMMPLLDNLPEDARAMALIKWAGDTVISRNNPVVVLAGYALGLSDERLDALFDVQPVE